MDPHDASIHIDTLLALLLIASATAVVIKWVRVPYAVALVNCRTNNRSLQDSTSRLNDTGFGAIDLLTGSSV